MFRVFLLVAALALRGCAILFLTTTTAHAADIDVSSLGPNAPSLVSVSGPLVSGDRELFLRRIISVSSAIVAFNSDGGNLLAGLQIGEVIRLKNFSTLVPKGAHCASSCALAWLGGTKRWMAPDAKIGFHSAYNGETGQVTGPGNALVGAYLNKIGLPYNAVVYITAAAPNSMAWLSKSDAVTLGIDVALFENPLSPARPEKSAVVLSQPRPMKTDESGGYAVQVSSQRTESDARAAYRELQRRYPSVLGSRSASVRRADLADNQVFYRAVIGPFDTPDDASQFCGHLKSVGGQCVVQKN
jgi:hypothetical protein